MSNTYPFPRLQLSDYEKQYVSHYQSGKKPGVLKRVYRVDLINFDSSAPSPYPVQYPSPLFAGTIQISRRAKVCALTFLGDIASWYLDVKTASGESMFPTAPTSLATTQPPGALVSSIVSGIYSDADATTGEGQVNDQLFVSLPFDIDPAWELSPNQSMVFSGQLAPAVSPTATRFLSIGIHVWEFPGMSGR